MLARTATTFTTTPRDNKAVFITLLFIGERLFNSPPSSRAVKLSGSYNPYHVQTDGLYRLLQKLLVSGQTELIQQKFLSFEGLNFF